MKNVEKKLTKQDYVDMMYDALKQFKKGEYTTVNLMTKYLISKSKYIDSFDEESIRLIVYKTFLALKKAGYFKARKFNEYKSATNDLSEIKLVVEDTRVIDSNDIIIEKLDA